MMHNTYAIEAALCMMARMGDARSIAVKCLLTLAPNKRFPPIQMMNQQYFPFHLAREAEG